MPLSSRIGDPQRGCFALESVIIMGCWPRVAASDESLIEFPEVGFNGVGVLIVLGYQDKHRTGSTYLGDTRV